VKATMQGLESLRRPEDVAKLRGISVREVLGVGDGAAPEQQADENGKAEAPASAEAVAAESAESASPESAEPAPADTGDSPPEAS
jgi:small subunit ribosomal protein S5